MKFKEWLLLTVSKISKILIALSGIAFVLGILLSSLPDLAGNLGITLSDSALGYITVGLGAVSLSGGVLTSASAALKRVALLNKTETDRQLDLVRKDQERKDAYNAERISLMQNQFNKQLEYMKLEHEKEVKIMNEDLVKRFDLLLRAQAINAERSIRLGISTDEEKEQYKQLVELIAVKIQDNTIKASIKDIIEKL